MAETIMHRLFYALLPPALCARLIGVIRDELAELRNLVRDDRLHVTMGISSDFETYPEPLAHRMIEIGDAIAAAPVPVSLDRLSAGRDSVALRPSRPSRALRDLAACIDAPLRRLGPEARRPDWTFSPHVTLGYRKGEPFSRTIHEIGWEAQELVLIHSEVGATRHRRVKSWPLEARQGAFDF